MVSRTLTPAPERPTLLQAESAWVDHHRQHFEAFKARLPRFCRYLPGLTELQLSQPDLSPDGTLFSWLVGSWDGESDTALGRIPVPNDQGALCIQHELRVVPLLSRRGTGLFHALCGALRKALQRVASYGERHSLEPPMLRGMVSELLEQALKRRSERLDTTNPVAERAHLRKVVLSKRKMVLSKREVVPELRGLVCPLETPESDKIGLIGHLALGATLNAASLGPQAGDFLFGSSAALIPFLEHNDPNRAMMGAKYLKQALPLGQAEAPRIRSGWEEQLFPKHQLLVRADGPGRVTELSQDRLLVEYDGMGAQPIELARRQRRAAPGLQVGQPLAAGQLLAHSWFCTPQGELALGLNVLTALMPWHGYNMEDALVISQSLAERLTSLHSDGPKRLQIGDKLASRHGGKGVVAAIVADACMPQLGDGRAVELLLNPHSLPSRMNLGLLYEIQCEAPGDYPPFRQQRSFRPAERKTLHWQHPATGQPRQATVVVGWLYMLKLHHRAEAKLSLPGPARRSSITGLPLGGRARGGAQRVGEMEVWALQAHGARHTLAEMLAEKSELSAERDSFLVLQEYLRAMGIASHFDGQQFSLKRAEGSDVRNWAGQAVSQAGLVEERYRCACGFSRRAGEWKQSGAKSGPRRCPQCQGSEVRLEMDWHQQGLMGEKIFGPRKERERRQGARIDFPRPLPHPLWPKATIDCWYVLPPALRPWIPGESGVNQHYRALVLQAQVWSKAPDKPPPMALQRTLKRLLRCLRLQGKRGLLRGALLGRRVSDSGRAVIVPDPQLPLGWCRLPEPLHAQGREVLLQRAPSLHRYNFMGFQVAPEPSPGPVIMLSPLHCTAFAADFDGDTMAFHFPRSCEARHECRQLLNARHHLFSVAHGQQLLHLEQDILAGAFLWSLQPGGLDQQQQLLNTSLEPRKAPLHRAITGALRQGLPLEQLESWVRTCCEKVTEAGLSFGLQELDQLDLDGLEPESDRGQPLAVMVASGARGSTTQLKRMLHSAHSSQPTASLLAGPSPDEYWQVCQQARQEMLPKKLGTPKGGDLMRKLVYGLYPLVVCPGDCGARPWQGKRSPLNCKQLEHDRVCQGCYGIDPASGALVAPEAPVGLLAAQSIGERATQDFMKVFQGTHGAAVSHLEKARKFLQFGQLPDELSGQPEHVLQWLMHDVYEDKVQPIHFELVLARMREGKEGWQGLDTVARRRASPLARACFQSALQYLKKAAETGEVEKFEQAPASLVIGRADVRTPQARD